MKIAAAVGLLALAGCNQIFGLDKTDIERVDAQVIVIDTRNSPISLAYLVAGADSFGRATTPEKVAIPANLFERLDVGPKAAMELSPATYDEATASIQVPDSIVTQDWRLVFKLVDGPVYHYTIPAHTFPSFVIPIWGRVERTPLPSDMSGFLVKIPAYPNPQDAFHRVYTSGAWTSGPFNPIPHAGDYHQASTIFSCAPEFPSCTKATHFTSPPDSPDSSRGDMLLLVDLVPFTSGVAQGRRAIGAADFQGALVSGSQTQTDALWSSDGTKVRSVRFNPMDTGRMNDLPPYDATGIPDSQTMTVQYGYIPHPSMPLFELPRASDVVPAPVFLELYRIELPPDMTMLGTFFEPVPLEDRFTQVLYHHGAWKRRLFPDGPVVASGIGTVVLSIAGTATHQHNAPKAIDVMLGTANLSANNQSLAMRPRIKVADATSLSFAATTASTDDPADFWQVRIHEVIGQTTVVHHVITSRETTVVLDPLVWKPGVYTLEIRSHTGRPAAQTLDFASMSIPQSISTIFTDAFEIIP